MANDGQRDAIAQAMLAQQATPESQALMLASPAAYYDKYGGGPQGYGGDPNFDPIAAQSQPPDPMAQRAAQMQDAQTPSAFYHGFSPQEYGSYFTPKPMPSGGVDEQSPKLFAWAGYSDPGRAPGGTLPFYGNGASAYANPDYWFGNGAGAQGLRGVGNNSAQAATAASQALMLSNPAAYYAQYGGGPGNSGDAGMGGMGGGPSGGGGGGGPFGPGNTAVGPTGISPNEANQAAANRGSPDRGDPTSPTGWGANATGFNDYGAPAGPLGYGSPASFGNNQGFNQGGLAATQGQPSAGTAFGPNGWGGFGLGATGLAGTVAYGNSPYGSVIGSLADAVNAAAAQAAQDAADDAEADAADGDY